MTEHPPISKRAERTILIMIVLLFAAMSIVGITWGLPSRTIDKYLFGGDPPWPGEKIYRLAGAAAKFSPDRGADVDADPLDKPGDEPILLTGTDEDAAKIYLRYRLYTYQPDEMITMMALAGMNPRRFDLDPRLYQYGGLFIYPVGACIGVCGLLGLIDVRGDVVHYLDHPDEFGKFYVVARAYSAAWGLVGVIVVFAMTRRLASMMGGMGKRSLPVQTTDAEHDRNTKHAHARTGLLAALLFTLMPVVVCMAHEGKPHLPGAVLMLLAVLFGMRHLSSQRAADFWLMAACCGAAFGMVLSSWPIFVLIPLVAWLDVRRGTRDFRVALLRTIGGVLPGVLVYLATNPYIVINAFVNRDVLRSNFGNSLAMYEIARIGEGFVRVIELTIEGATLPVLILGTIALIVAFVVPLIRMGKPSTTPGGTASRSAAVDESQAARGDDAGNPHARATLGHGTRPQQHGHDGCDPQWRTDLILVLAVPAVAFFLQFVLIGAGKPAEYGRFGIFTNTALAIGTACLFVRRRTRFREIVNGVAVTLVLFWVGLSGTLYLRSFHVDEAGQGSRMQLAAYVDRLSVLNPVIGVAAEPAPYSCPPLNFSRADLLRFHKSWQFEQRASASWSMFVEPVDRRVAGWDDSARMGGGPTLAPRLPANATVRVHHFVHTYWPQERYGRVAALQVLERRLSTTETPISWANKPFAVTSVMFREWKIDDPQANHEPRTVDPQQ